MRYGVEVESKDDLLTTSRTREGGALISSVLEIIFLFSFLVFEKGWEWGDFDGGCSLRKCIVVGLSRDCILLVILSTLEAISVRNNVFLLDLIQLV